MDEDKYVARLKLIRDIAKRMGRVNYKQVAVILRLSPNTASQLCGAAAYYFPDELVYHKGWLTYVGEERGREGEREEEREEERVREILGAKPVEEDIVEVERV